MTDQSIDRSIGRKQSGKDREASWESVCRVLAVILAVADSPRSGAGRVGLLLGGVIEALMPCLGLPKPEVIRSALEVRCRALMVDGSFVVCLFWFGLVLVLFGSVRFGLIRIGLVRIGLTHEKKRFDLLSLRARPSSTNTYVVYPADVCMFERCSIRCWRCFFSCCCCRCCCLAPAGACSKGTMSAGPCRLKYR